MDKVPLVRGGAALALALGGLDDRVLGRHARGDVHAVFVQLVFWRAGRGGAGSDDVSNIDVCVTATTR